MRNVTPALPPGQANKLAVLLDALDGVALSDGERASLTWLAGFETHTVENDSSDRPMQAAPGSDGVPRRIAPTSLIVPSGSTVRSVHHQAPLTIQAPRSLSLPLRRGSRPGVAPRGIGEGFRRREGCGGR